MHIGERLIGVIANTKSSKVRDQKVLGGQLHNTLGSTRLACVQQEVSIQRNTRNIPNATQVTGAMQVHNSRTDAMTAFHLCILAVALPAIVAYFSWAHCIRALCYTRVS